jgi:hypothetical protein
MHPVAAVGTAGSVVGTEAAGSAVALAEEGLVAAVDEAAGSAAAVGTADRWAPTPAASRSSCKLRTSRFRIENHQL